MNKELEKEFIPYNEALAMKELGFDEECFGLFVRDKSLLIKQMPNQKECEEYFGGILAPTFSQAFGWFREKHNLDSEIYMNHEYGSKFYTYLVLQLDRAIISHLSGATGKLPEYEEAELACLKKLIEIAKENK